MGRPPTADGRSDPPRARTTAGPGIATRLSLERTVEALTGQPATPLAVGPYRVIDRLGAGGMGVVFLAHDDRLDRRVAIKVLRRDVADLGTPTSAVLDEARALARLDHPNLVTVHEVGESDGQSYIVMEYIEGRDLRTFAADASGAEVLRVLLDAARGLAAAHRGGVVHGDFKPENVLVDRSGRARVIDFGVAGLARALDGRTSAGTPGYVAPEVTRGEPITPRSDVYALAVVFFELLCGRRPAGARDVTGPLPRGAPPRLLRVLRAAASADPAARPPDAGAFVAAAEATARRHRRWRRAAVAGAAAAVFTIAGAWIARAPADRGDDPRAHVPPVTVPALTSPAPADPHGVYTARLENGLTVFLVPRPADTTVEARLVIRAGYPDERGRPGLAHLALVAFESGGARLGARDATADRALRQREAALFDALARTEGPTERAESFAALDELRRSAKDVWTRPPIAPLLSGMGARRYGALQGWDLRTVVELPTGRLRSYLAFEAERLGHPALRDFWRLVVAAIREAGASAKITAPGERLADRLVTEHLGYPVDPAAEIDTLARFPYRDAAAFLDRTVAPNRAALILIGGFDPQMAFAAVRAAFEPLAAGPPAPPPPRARPLGASVERTTTGPTPRTDVAFPLDPTDARVQVAADLLVRLLDTPPPGLPSGWRAARVPFELRFFKTSETAPPDPDELRTFLRSLDPETLAPRIPRLRLARSLALESKEHLADHLADLFTFGVPWRALAALDTAEDAVLTGAVANLAADLARAPAVVVRTEPGPKPAVPIPPLPEPSPIAFPETLDPVAEAIAATPGVSQEPRFLYEGRDYQLSVAGGRLFLAVPDDGPVVRAELFAPHGGATVAACIVGRALEARARRIPALEAARVRVRCTDRALIVSIAMRTRDEPAVRAALADLLARPTGPNAWAEARARVQARLSRHRRDPRRLGHALLEIALFGRSSGRTGPDALADDDGTVAPIARAVARGRFDLAVTGGDADAWRAWFEAHPAGGLDRTRRAMAGALHDRTVIEPDLGLAHAAWAAVAGPVPPPQVASAEIVRTVLTARLGDLERQVGTQGPVRIQWLHDDRRPAPSAALVVEAVLPPGRVEAFYDAVEEAAARPWTDGEIEGARAQVEALYRTLGTPRRRVARFVHDFVAAGETTDPRAAIWATLPGASAAQVRALARTIAQGRRVRALATPGPVPSEAVQPADAPMIGTTADIVPR